MNNDFQLLYVEWKSQTETGSLVMWKVKKKKKRAASVVDFMSA